jgi:hypothetical protein
MGSRKESIPPSAWTESGRTPVLTESSSSRERRGGCAPGRRPRCAKPNVLSSPQPSPSPRPGRWPSPTPYRGPWRGDPVTVAAVKVVVLQPSAAGPRVSEEDVRGPSDVALAGVVLAEQHERSLSGKRTVTRSSPTERRFLTDSCSNARRHPYLGLGITDRRVCNGGRTIGGRRATVTRGGARPSRPPWAWSRLGHQPLLGRSRCQGCTGPRIQ